MATLHLPYGVVRLPDGRQRCVVRDGDDAVDLGFDAPVLNDFLALGRAEFDLATAPRYPLSSVTPVLPIEVGDYVDFYASLEHATNVGRIFRPDGAPLLSNWRHLPVGYQGRAGSIVVSGTDVRRPAGILGPGKFGPTRALDFELEVAFVAGGGGEVFGVALLNDWSARDIQAFEYQPLGPFLGKSFSTSMSAWITPLAALADCWVDGPPQDPPPLAHLQVAEPAALAIELTVEVNGEVVGRSNSSWLYWRMAQMVAHLTSNGATLRPGDVFASGTVSGFEPGTHGCLLEATKGTAYLADGDEVVLRGRAGDAELGECRGRVVSA